MKTLLLFALTMSIFGCTKKDVSLEETKWKVTQYTDKNGATTKNGIVCEVTFNNGSLNMKLDVNACFGSYVLKNNNKISFTGGAGCTKACCDEPESEKATLLITSCNAYKIDGPKLTLSDNDGIEVVLKEVE